MYHIYRHILYLACTCYNCLPEDEPSASKHIHVEDIVKIKLYDYITMQGKNYIKCTSALINLHNAYCGMQREQVLYLAYGSTYFRGK